jgi:hypothetical protein
LAKTTRKTIVSITIISITIFLVLALQPLAFVAPADAAWADAGGVLDWMHNSGILASGNQVIEGAKWAGSSWQLSTGAYGSAVRTDAEGEAALALLYSYEFGHSTSDRDKAVALLHQMESEARSSNRYPAVPSWNAASKPVYTQDNGRAMKALAKAVEQTTDSQVRTWLLEMANWWDTKVTSDGSVGVGIDAVQSGDHLTPPAGVCARATTELLIGFVRAYQATNQASMKATAVRLGNWLVSHMAGDHLPCPPYKYTDNYGNPPVGLMNGGLGNLVETNSLGLRGLSLLFKVTLDARYKTCADTIFLWIKGECDKTYSKWSAHVPSEYNRGTDYSKFNTLYMFTPQGLCDYYSVSSNQQALTYANEIVTFMVTRMSQSGPAICNGGIVGEWDFSTNSRSQLVDDEGMIWGNWIYTGWTNCEYVEAVGMLGGGGPPPNQATFTIITCVGSVRTPLVQVSITKDGSAFGTRTTNGLGTFGPETVTVFGSFKFSATHDNVLREETINLQAGDAKTATLDFNTAPPPPDYTLWLGVGGGIGVVGVFAFYKLKKPTLVIPGKSKGSRRRRKHK